ncbi:hypothetical protein WMW72_20325 [Paenibacillus filicis]|uniref:Uncharacterized protein n=1 Tax=Paenibacillus filicis TaxID=669464 RepID=A0ABU9DPW8_9BACL
MGDQDYYKVHNLNGKDYLILIDEHFFKRVDQRNEDINKFNDTYLLLANQGFIFGNVNERLVVRNFQKNISFIYAVETVTEYDTDRFDQASNFSEKVYFVTYFDHAENLNQKKVQRNILVTPQGSIFHNQAISSDDYIIWFTSTQGRTPRTLFN